MHLEQHLDPPKCLYWPDTRARLVWSGDGKPHGRDHAFRWTTRAGEATRALVLVHGLKGDPIGTWGENFFVLLSGDMRSKNLDIFSFGYDSTFRRARISAIRLLDLLRRLASCYDEVRIVAHSLGAVVARIALLEAIHATRPPNGGPVAPWQASIRLFLFAPAHNGSPLLRDAELFRVGTITDFLVAAMATKANVLVDLDPSGPTLEGMREETKAAMSSTTRSYLVAQTVVLGSMDPLVHPTRFVDDPTPEIIWGGNHWSVCKPSPEYRCPVDVVLSP